MNKYEMTTERKKKAIVHAALTLFNEKGFMETSIKEIAAFAYVSQVSIYNYFGSKEKLVSECLKIIIHGTLQRAVEILQKDISYQEKLQMALALCSEELSLAVSNHFSEKALDDPKMVEHLLESVNRSKADVYRVYIEQGKREGCIDASISTETILDYMEAINIVGSKVELNEDAPAKFKHIQQLFLYGVLGELK